MRRRVMVPTLILSSLAAAARGSPVQPWPRTAPESVGLAPAALAALDEVFAAGAVPLVDSLLVVRCGAVAFERRYTRDYATIYRGEAHERGPLNAQLKGPYNYFDPASHPYYQGTDAHTLQSITKSVTSATIGAAIARGDFKAALDTPVLRYFDIARVRNLDAMKNRMTLRHLLTMTAGLEWHEDLAYTDPRNSSSLMEATRDWVAYAIDQPMAQEPGATFNYSSGATELLAHIFRQETGQDIEHYARRHLFAPLGIRHYHWKRTPLGVVDTEGGLYLSGGDLARIGYLYLQRGAWNGRRLLSPEWVRDSLAPQVEATGARKYGYQWWLIPYGAGPHFAWAALGLGGQYLLVFPEDELIVVVTAWRILDVKPYVDLVIDRIRSAVREHRCLDPAAEVRPQP